MKKIYHVIKDGRNISDFETKKSATKLAKSIDGEIGVEEVLDETDKVFEFLKGKRVYYKNGSPVNWDDLKREYILLQISQIKSK